MRRPGSRSWKISSGQRRLRCARSRVGDGWGAYESVHEASGSRASKRAPASSNSSQIDATAIFVNTAVGMARLIEGRLVPLGGPAGQLVGIGQRHLFSTSSSRASACSRPSSYSPSSSGTTHHLRHEPRADTPDAKAARANPPQIAGLRRANSPLAASMHATTDSQPLRMGTVDDMANYTLNDRR